MRIALDIPQAVRYAAFSGAIYSLKRMQRARHSRSFRYALFIGFGALDEPLYHFHPIIDKS